MKTLNHLDGRHKLAVVGAIVCWALSLWFSYLGFKIDNTQITWVGWFLAGIVTVVELVFNSRTGKLSLTLIVTGALCYMYGIWTNITGFWSLQHPGDPFVLWQSISVVPSIIGGIMEILPEPLFMWGIMAAMDGDFLGNLIGLWNGELKYATPSNETVKTQSYNIPQQIPRKTVVPTRPTPAPPQHEDFPGFLAKGTGYKSETHYQGKFRKE